MNRSEQINELAAALSKAQGLIKGAVKGKENSFYHSAYADLPAVMDACRESLSKNNIAVIQAPEFSTAPDGFVEMWIDTMLAHSSGQWISSRYPVKPTKDDPQGYGSAITYARRYALMSMVGVVADDGSDDDGNAASGHSSAPSKPIPPKKAAETAGRTQQTDAAADAAKAFGQKVLTTLGGFRTKDEYKLWDSPEVETKIAKLKQYDSKLWDEVVAKLQETDARLG
jgi:hypothetical protein